MCVCTYKIMHISLLLQQWRESDLAVRCKLLLQLAPLQIHCSTSNANNCVETYAQSSLCKILCVAPLAILSICV